MMIVCASVNVFVASETNGRPPRADKVVLKMLILVFELRMLLPKSLDHFFTQGPNHLITSSSHTGRTTRSPLSLSPPLPPLSVAAVAAAE